MKSSILTMAALLTAILACSAGAQQNYVIINLTPGSPWASTIANGINNLGVVTGAGIDPATNTIEAMVCQNGHYKPLGFFGYYASVGIGINNSDQVAADGEDPGTAAFLYSKGTATNLGSVDGGYTYASGMNNLGDVVGSAINGDGNRVGFAYLHGTFYDLSSIGAIKANAINDSREIAGSSGYYWVHNGYGHSSLHGFLYAGGTFTDLGSLTGDPTTNTEALAINASGEITGYSTASDGLLHAFLYTNNVMQDLGTIGSYYAIPVAINKSGLIVGNITNQYTATIGPFVYANGAMTYLTSLIVNGSGGWSQMTVAGMNDNGWIVGSGDYAGELDGFIAVPASAMVPDALTMSPHPITGGHNVEGTVYISAAAPTGGLTVTLASHKPAILQVPASVSVPAGAKSVKFTATTTAITTTKLVAVTASANGIAFSTVIPVTNVALLSLKLAPNTVPGGSTSTGTVTLSRSLPFDVTVALASNGPSFAQTPGSVTVTAHTRSATFTITTSTVKATRHAAISALFGGGTITHALTVTP
ncbi:MAG: hypothetical protein KGJ62_13980 [Armatimonadetes bacterium]|nr:hypothetical protein [Armatimonadota bacterium]MDE2206806.1 hypothetical protein [Armatimonadota bacterium]